MKWQKEKPTKPCIVATRNKKETGGHEFYSFKIYFVDDVGLCVAERNNIGEWEDIELENYHNDFNYDEYLVLGSEEK